MLYNTRSFKRRHCRIVDRLGGPGRIAGDMRIEGAEGGDWLQRTSQARVAR